MHRLWSFLLISMLVLRGLLGDAMAMGMLPAVGLQASTSAAASHALKPHVNGYPAEFLHHGHESGGDASASAFASHCDPDPSADHHTASAACSACGICHSAVSPLPLLPTPAVAVRHAAPHSNGTRYASAQLPQACKPPIV